MKQCEKWPLAEVNIDDCLIKGLYKLFLNSSKILDNQVRGYKTFSCSTQLSTKFQLQIKTKILTNKEISCF